MVHSIICPKNGALVELSRHCHNIVRFFVFDNPYSENQVSSWFQLASGIKEVSYKSDMYDDLVQWCGPAIEYENEKSKFHSRLIKELAIFSFIWGGFEAYLDTIELPKCPKYPGKINSVNFLLKERFENNFSSLKYYPSVVKFLTKLILKNPWYLKGNNMLTINNCDSSKINGLRIVYQIRNSFAHGAFRINEPPDWNIIKPFDIPIIAASSRIVLFTIQMLILVTHENLNFQISEIHRVPEEEGGIDALNFIQKMHLQKFRYS
jgi:hypothetical protein